jgi:hypothetical protein
MKEIPDQAKKPQMVYVYDNINFKNTKRDEHLGHKGTMESLTTAAIVHCPELPTTRLTQSMFTSTSLLNIKDIWKSLADNGDETGKDISRALIASAIQRVHTQGVGSGWQWLVFRRK